MVLNSDHGAYFCGRFSPDACAVKPKMRPGPLKMCTCICSSIICDSVFCCSQHLNEPPFQSPYSKLSPPEERRQRNGYTFRNLSLIRKQVGTHLVLRSPGVDPIGKQSAS